MLSLVALLLGLALIVKHLLGLVLPAPLKAVARRFARSSFWGKLLLTLAALWAFALAATTDLGEFSSLRTPILGGIVLSSLLFGGLVPEFLSVRSLGFILLLAGKPLLELAFLKSGMIPILLSLLAYLWIIVGLLNVSMPYLFRNAMSYITAPEQSSLWRFLCWTGLLYGILLFLGGGWLLIIS